MIIIKHILCFIKPIFWAIVLLQGGASAGKTTEGLEQELVVGKEAKETGGGQGTETHQRPSELQLWLRDALL